MAQLTIRKTYADGTTPTQLDLDNICDSIETFLNITGLYQDNISANSITASTKVEPASITNSKFEVGSITTAKIADSNITTIKIADEMITSAKINDLAITTAKITDGTVQSSKFNAAAITTAKIADSTLTSSKIAANAITTTKITDDNVMAYHFYGTDNSVYGYYRDSGTITLSTSSNSSTLNQGGSSTRHMLSMGSGYIESYTGGTAGTEFQHERADIHLVNMSSSTTPKVYSIEPFYYTAVYLSGAYFRLPASCIKTLNSASTSTSAQIQTASNARVSMALHSGDIL